VKVVGTLKSQPGVMMLNKQSTKKFYLIEFLLNYNKTFIKINKKFVV
jgi:hypothetical protein